MTSRRELDRALACHPVVGSEPREDIFRHLGIHPDRLNFKNLPMEAKVWGKSFLRSDRPKPFVIYGRPRSGTTLLVRLLDQIPDVRCDGELLHYFLINPAGFLARLPRRAGPDVKAYGVKLISYHLLEIQRVRRPLAFFDKIAAHGYSVIHLTRNSWDQTLSLAKAQLSGVYFSKSGSEPQTLRIEPERFLALLEWNEKMLSYERDVMKHVDHVPVHYDSDLKSAALHQPTIDRLCEYLGVQRADVGATLRRTGGKEGLQQVDNLDAIAAFVRKSALAHLVPQNLQ